MLADRISVRQHQQEARFHPLYAARVVAKGWGHGGYAWFAVTSDGALLCASCVRENWAQIVRSGLHGLRDGWRVVGFTSSGEMEDAENCAHCGKAVNLPS